MEDNNPAVAALVEFVDFSEDHGGARKVRKVKKCLINGEPVLLARDFPPEIHGVDDWDEGVMVTLTLFAREIRIGAPRDAGDRRD